MYVCVSTVFVNSHENITTTWTVMRSVQYPLSSLSGECSYTFHDCN